MECGALDLLNKLAELSLNYNIKQQEAIQPLVDKLEILVNNNNTENTISSDLKGNKEKQSNTSKYNSLKDVIAEQGYNYDYFSFEMEHPILTMDGEPAVVYIHSVFDDIDDFNFYIDKGYTIIKNIKKLKKSKKRATNTDDWFNTPTTSNTDTKITDTSITDLPEKFQTILATTDVNISNEFALRLQIGVYKTYNEAYKDLLDLADIDNAEDVNTDKDIPEFQKTNTPNTGKFDEKLNKRLQELLKKLYPNIKLDYKDLGKNIRGKADIKALSVLINPELQTQDTLPHEYAHHYIAMFKESPIVQTGIKKYGTEEALVQAIGEQVVVQKGLAYNWWKKFSTWVKGLFKKLDNKSKEELRNILTNNFLEAKDLKTYDDMDTYIYNKILNKLETMYPDVKDSVDKYTKKELVLAVDSYVNNADISIKKYADIYVNMLEKSTFVNNLITKVSKDCTITREEAKHKISEGIKDDLLDIGLGKSFDNSILGKILKFIKYTFAKIFNKKQFEQYKIDFNIKQLALNIYNGENAEAISFKPKKGTKKVNPTNDFKQQPKAASIIYDVMEASNNTAVFTGSEALAMQGTIYRKQGKNGTDLHDLDFALLDSTPETISKIIYKLQQNSEITVLFDFSIPDNEAIMNALGKIGNLAKIDILEPLGKYAAKNFLKSSSVLTLAVTPKGTKLANIKRFNEHSTSSRIVAYDIVDTNNKVVGTYEADIERNPSGFTTTIVAERTTGIQAIWVDLSEDKKKTLEDTFNWVAPNGSTVTVAKAATIFDAKNLLAPFIPRTKDVRDFNSFYKDSKEGIGVLKPEYENKIIVANSGSGKTFLASNYDKIIDSDDVLVNLLGIDSTDYIVKAFKKIKNKDKIYKKLADELVILRDKGYTILTPSTNKHILKVSDIAVLQNDKYTIQKRTSNSTRTNTINRSLQQAKNSIDFFKTNIRNSDNNIKIIELLPSEFLSDELTYNKGDIIKNKLTKKMYNKYKSKIKECE